jgi:hypothetical protein
MKIALCFSGQPRFISEVSPFVIDNVIGDCDVDVFAHLWFDEKLQIEPYKYGGENWKDQRILSTAVDDFKKIYNPKLIKVEPSKRFLNSNLSDNYLPSLKRYKWGAIDNVNEPDFSVRDINNITSYYCSLNQVCLLKKEYEYQNNFKYDFVIKMRTDSIVHNQIDYKTFDQNTLYYSGLQNQPDGMINDWFNFGGSRVMDVMMGSFPLLDTLIMKCMKDTEDAWCCELIHRKMLDYFEIAFQALPIHITLPRF